jgi:hypothetical protein
VAEGSRANPASRSARDGELGPGVPGVFVVEKEICEAAGAVGGAAVCDESVDLAETGGENVPPLGAAFSLVDARGTHACVVESLATGKYEMARI